jgi:hypothetical protein
MRNIYSVIPAKAGICVWFKENRDSRFRGIDVIKVGLLDANWFCFSRQNAKGRRFLSGLYSAKTLKLLPVLLDARGAQAGKAVTLD